MRAEDRAAGSILVPHRLADAAPAARLRIYCFPYGGGSQSAFDWLTRGLPAGVELATVAMPEGPAFEHVELSRRLAAQAGALADAHASSFRETRFVLFGYSVGSLAAFEFAKRLRDLRGLEPDALIVAACVAPQLLDRSQGTRGFPPPDAPDEELVRAFREFQLLPPGFDLDPELLEAVLQRFREAYGMFLHYAHEPAPRFDCPVLAIGGADDPLAGPTDLDGWREVTNGPFERCLLPGGHMFAREDRAAFAATLREFLKLVGVPTSAADA